MTEADDGPRTLTFGLEAGASRLNAAAVGGQHGRNILICG